MYNIICALAHIKFAFLGKGTIGIIATLNSRTRVSNRYSINNN